MGRIAFAPLSAVLLGTLRPPQAPAVMVKLSETKGFHYILRLLIMRPKQGVLGR